MASRSRQDRRAAIPPALVTRLTRWFSKNARDLPWRRNPTPYRVWVSEVMLQQTRVEVVRGYFQRFMKRFPTVKALAAAHEDEVLAAWSGLGYYRRARMLHAAAKQIVERHNGRFPRDAAAIEALPGVGRYTAGAIRSIAFNEPAPIVDGNVERVFARIRAVRDPVKSPGVQRRVWQWAGAWVAQAAALGTPPRDANQSLMELGATVCTPRAPRCTSCPASRWCKGTNNAETFPAAAQRLPTRDVHLLFVRLSDAAGRIWLVRREAGRPPSLLPDGLWELPHILWSGTAREAPLEQLTAAIGCKIARLGRPFTRRHAIMNARVKMTLLPARTQYEPHWAHGAAAWFDVASTPSLPQASATRKLLATS